jgi:hypothetical protein
MPTTAVSKTEYLLQNLKAVPKDYLFLRAIPPVAVRRLCPNLRRLSPTHRIGCSTVLLSFSQSLHAGSSHATV